MHGDFPEDLSKERESSYKVRLSDFLALKLKDNAAKINKIKIRVKGARRFLQSTDLVSCTWLLVDNYAQ